MHRVLILSAAVVVSASVTLLSLADEPFEQGKPVAGDTPAPASSSRLASL